jgi:hypothetical protein
MYFALSPALMMTCKVSNEHCLLAPSFGRRRTLSRAPFLSLIINAGFSSCHTLSSVPFQVKKGYFPKPQIQTDAFSSLEVLFTRV